MQSRRSGNTVKCGAYFCFWWSTPAEWTVFCYRNAIAISWQLFKISSIEHYIVGYVRSIDTFSYAAQCPQLKIKLQNFTVSVYKKSHCLNVLVYI